MNLIPLMTTEAIPEETIDVQYRTMPIEYATFNNRKNRGKYNNKSNIAWTRRIKKLLKNRSESKRSRPEGCHVNYTRRYHLFGMKTVTEIIRKKETRKNMGKTWFRPTSWKRRYVSGCYVGAMLNTLTTATKGTAKPICKRSEGKKKKIKSKQN